MAYATTQDVQDAAGGEERLVALTGGKSKGTVQTDVVDRFVAKADSIIDSYASALYKTGFEAPVPQSIVTMSADIAVYLLKQSKSMLTEGDIAAHDRRIEWLQELAKGSVTPGTDPRPTKHSAVIDKASARPSAKDVSREELKGFW